jgi:hypothetical protein
MKFTLSDIDHVICVSHCRFEHSASFFLASFLPWLRDVSSLTNDGCT